MFVAQFTQDDGVFSFKSCTLNKASTTVSSNPIIQQIIQSHVKNWVAKGGTCSAKVQSVRQLIDLDRIRELEDRILALEDRVRVLLTTTPIPATLLAF